MLFKDATYHFVNCVRLGQFDVIHGFFNLYYFPLSNAIRKANPAKMPDINLFWIFI